MASSGSASSRRNQNKKMAGNLKALGVERTSGRCPVCYAIINIGKPSDMGRAMVNHIDQHARGYREKGV